MKSKTTPDERFLVKLYQSALSQKDPFASFDYRVIGAAVGLKETAIKNILKHLMQANLIKKREETLIYLTERGYHLAEQISFN